MANQTIVSAQIQEKLQLMPESAYGINRVIAILDDGTRIDDVQIAWAREIVKVGKSTVITFDASRIVDVLLQ